MLLSSLVQFLEMVQYVWREGSTALRCPDRKPCRILKTNNQTTSKVKSHGWERLTRIYRVQYKHFFAFSALYSGCSNAIGMQEHLSLYRNTRHPKHFYINMLSTKTSTGGTRLRNSKVLEPTKSFWILAKAVGLLRMQQYPMNHFRQAKP